MNLTVPTSCYDFKACETGRQPFGGLTVPEAGLAQYILKAEQIFIAAFPNLALLNNQYQ
jgi:hypothetical protein